MKGTTVLALFGALGGLAVFIGGVWAVLRGLIRLIDATRDNTTAIKGLTGKVDTLALQQTSNTERITQLERGRRR